VGNTRSFYPLIKKIISPSYTWLGDITELIVDDGMDGELFEEELLAEMKVLQGFSRKSSHPKKYEIINLFFKREVLLKGGILLEPSDDLEVVCKFKDGFVDIDYISEEAEKIPIAKWLFGRTNQAPVW